MSNIALAKATYENFATGNIPGVLDAMHPEVHWYEAEGNPYKPDGKAWVGPQAVLENLFVRLGAEWDGFGITIHQLHDAGDVVVMEGRYSGVYKANGKTLDCQVSHVLQFRGGKLLRFQQYADTAAMQATMAD